MTDADVLSYFFVDSKGNLHEHIIKNKIKNISQEMADYLYCRYDDSDLCSINEIVWRIKLHIEHKPTCKICGNYLPYLRKGTYAKYCSRSCTATSTIRNIETLYGVKSTLCLDSPKEKTKKTLKEKYGVSNISQNENIKLKKKKSFEEHFGYQNNFCNKTILEKAIINSQNEISKTKREHTNLERYGVAHFTETFKGKHLSKEHKQKISDYMKSEDAQQIRYETLSRNKTWNTSSYEENTYEELLKYYNENDIVRQYKCEEYPFYCDFYIKSTQTFIEVQCSQFHHFHAFDKDNNDDILELERLQKQTKPQYRQIINTWTIYDVRKRNIANTNNLSYYEIWPNDDIKGKIKAIHKETKIDS